MNRFGSQSALAKRFDAGGGTLLGPLAVELGNMTTLAAAGQTAGLIEKAELHRFVAIALGRANLQHVAGAGLDHRHRHDVARFVVNLRHPDLAAENPGRVAAAIVGYPEAGACRDGRLGD